MRQKRLNPSLLAAIALVCTSAANAGEPIQIGDAQLDWSLTASYNVGVRVGKPDPILTGEQWAWNSLYNDGNNNFDRWSLVNNRVSMLLQTKLSKGDSGLVVNGSTFYDDVYHNSNDSRPDKYRVLDNYGVPKNNPGNRARMSTRANFGEFTPEAKKYHGGYSRLLDVYAYTNLDLAGKRANIKFGRHVVSWGESLFFPNISMAQGPLDGSKANVPGTEIKEIMLPEDQVSISWQLSPQATLLANYQFNWHPTVPDAPGSYLARSDVIGPGGYCLVEYSLSQKDCYALPSDFNPDTGQTGSDKVVKLGAKRGDVLPPKKGQWGLGLRYRISEQTELGAYYLRYHDRIPMPEITYEGDSGFRRYPANWDAVYQPNISLIGASMTTSLGSYVVGAEIAHRRGSPVFITGETAVFSQRDRNGRSYTKSLYARTTANLTQVNLNTFANFGRTFLAPRTLLLAELAWVNVSGVKAIALPVCNVKTNCADSVPSNVMYADELRLYSKNNLGFQSRFQLDYPGVFDGWDLSVPITYAQQLMGRNPISNLGGKGDKILGVATEFTRGNLQLRADYVNYLGKPSTDDFGSRVLTDRDFVSVGAKYTF